jgi:hypothetical protein
MSSNTREIILENTGYFWTASTIFCNIKVYVSTKAVTDWSFSDRYNHTDFELIILIIIELTICES